MGPTDDLMLWIGYHSKVKGTIKDSFRIMISYVVDEVDSFFNQVHMKAGLP